MSKTKEIDSLKKQVLQGLTQSKQKMLALKLEKNTPIVVMQDHRIIMLKAEQYKP